MLLQSACRGVIVTGVVMVLFASVLLADGRDVDPQPIDPEFDLASQLDDTPRIPVEGVPAARGFPGMLLERDALTGDWWGTRTALEEGGIWIGVGLTQVYQLQLNSTAGLRTSRRSGRYTGRYDLEIELDLDKLVGVPGASVYAWAEGGWSSGIDESSIGSWQGVNSDAYLGNQAAQLSVMYYQQDLLEDRLRIRLGKLDSSGNAFDVNGHAVGANANAYAYDENSQFLNGGFLFDPSIPYPWYSLGASGVVVPTDWLYAYAAIVDDDPSDRGDSSTFKTAFRGPGYFFTNVETGVMTELPQYNGSGTLPGTYRFGLWHQNRPKEDTHGGDKRNDVGFYMSFDQMVFKERDDVEDVQGLGLFGRFGLTDGDVNPYSVSWSAGAQYEGLVPTRDQDVFGIGVTQVRFGDYAQTVKQRETACEAYYRTQITPWCHVTPSVQVVKNPGGEAKGDAVVAGVRLRLVF
jgi:porin